MKTKLENINISSFSTQLTSEPEYTINGGVIPGMTITVIWYPSAQCDPNPPDFICDDNIWYFINERTEIEIKEEVVIVGSDGHERFTL